MGIDNEEWGKEGGWGCLFDIIDSGHGGCPPSVAEDEGEGIPKGVPYHSDDRP